MNDEEKQRLAQSIISQGDIHAMQTQAWIGTSLHVSNWLLNPLTKEDIGSYESLFWIRLYGVIVEFGDPLKVTLEKFGTETFDDFKKQYPLNAEGESIIGMMYLLRDKSQELKGILTRDELILLENLRHTNCHIHQKRYELGVKGSKDDPKLKEHKQISTTGEVLHVDVIKNVLDSQMIKCNGDHLLLAQDINSRINKTLSELYELYLQFNS